MVEAPGLHGWVGPEQGMAGENWKGEFCPNFLTSFVDFPNLLHLSIDMKDSLSAKNQKYYGTKNLNEETRCFIVNVMSQ